jgi:hypothetical protein
LEKLEEKLDEEVEEAPSRRRLSALIQQAWPSAELGIHLADIDRFFPSFYF